MEDLLPLREALAETLNAAEPLDEKSTVKARRKHYEADMAFHLAIAELAGNPVLTTMLRSLLELLKPPPLLPNPPPLPPRFLLPPLLRSPPPRV